MARGFLTLLAAESATAATRASSSAGEHGKAFHSNGAKGILIRVTTDNESTIVATVAIRALMPNSSGGTSFVTVWTSAANITTDTDSTYLIYPGAIDGNYTEVDGSVLPNVFDFQFIVGSGTADTFASAQLLG